MESRQGIQSVEVAAPLLKALANASGPMCLSHLAKNAGMPAAKAHRYLVSLIRVGLIEQDPASGHYDLGPLALELGLVSLSRLDAIRLADEALRQLRQHVNETVALAAWGNLGPTYVRLLQSQRSVTVNLRLGNVLPLTYTASGLCFAAYLPEHVTAKLIHEELQNNKKHKLHGPQSHTQLRPLLQAVRDHGIARIIGEHQPTNLQENSRLAPQLWAGYNAYAAPVFNHLGEIQFALAVVGASVHLSGELQHPVGLATLQHAQQLSQRLGFRASNEKAD
jgi:DNA-binding IclR family transcriptional regulator